MKMYFFVEYTKINVMLKMKKRQVYTGLWYRVGLVPVRLTFTGILHGQLGDDGSSLEWGDTETYFLS